MSPAENATGHIAAPLILLLFPKYVAVLEGVAVADFYFKPGFRKNRFIDSQDRQHMRAMATSNGRPHPIPSVGWYTAHPRPCRHPR
jgi:hypothetical protein